MNATYIDIREALNSWNPNLPDILRAYLQVYILGAPDLINVLILGAHPDDEFLGPFGTIATLAAKQSNCRVFVFIFAASNRQRAQETWDCCRVAGLPEEQVLPLPFADGQLREHEKTVRSVLQVLMNTLRPALCISHRNDRHRDHRLLYEVSCSELKKMQTSLWHFLINQPTAVPWWPAAFMRISDEAALLKLNEGRAAYLSSGEGEKDFFIREILEGNLRYFGVCAGSKYAEGFQATQIFLTECEHGRLVLAPYRTEQQAGQAIHASRWAATKLVFEPCPCNCGVLAVARHGDAMRAVVKASTEANSRSHESRIAGHGETSQAETRTYETSSEEEYYGPD